MALTKQQIQEVAPTVGALSITVATINNRLAQVPADPEPQPEPEITVAIVGPLFTALTAGGRDIAKNIQALGGVGAVASEHGLTQAQVKTLAREFQNLISVYYA